MFEITLSTREWDSEGRAYIRQAGGKFELISGEARDGEFALIRATFPSIWNFVDAMSSIADEREPRN